MTTLAYPTAYDQFHRPPHLSRHHSIAYGPGGQQVAFPGTYNEMMTGMHGEPYPQPSYQIYAPPATTIGHHIPGSAWDDLHIRDSYYPEDHKLAGSYAVVPHATPHRRRRSISFSSSHGHRRHSSSSSLYATHPPVDNFRRLSSTNIKFKRKGALRAGITLAEAQANVRLSNSDSYTYQDLNADGVGRILMKIRWSGYTSLTYEIPLDGFDGRISLQTLARRVARACIHFLQTNRIPISWDRVELHHLEEISIGTWQPVLMSH